MLVLTLLGKPITKKNSMQIISCGGRPRLIQSKQYRQYEADCLKQILTNHKMYDVPIAVVCKYFLKDKRKTDLTNLLAATHDILQKAKVIADDALIKSVDGSRIVGVDKDNPRVEIIIQEMVAQC